MAGGGHFWGPFIGWGPPPTMHQKNHQVWNAAFSRLSLRQVPRPAAWGTCETRTLGASGMGKVFQPLETFFPIIGKLAKNFSNRWKNRGGFSNHWKIVFQSLETKGETSVRAGWRNERGRKAGGERRKGGAVCGGKVEGRRAKEGGRGEWKENRGRDARAPSRGELSTNFNCPQLSTNTSTNGLDRRRDRMSHLPGGGMRWVDGGNAGGPPALRQKSRAAGGRPAWAKAGAVFSGGSGGGLCGGSRRSCG